MSALLTLKMVILAVIAVASAIAGILSITWSRRTIRAKNSNIQYLQKHIKYLNAQIDSQSRMILDCFDRVNELESRVSIFRKERDRFCHAVNVIASRIGMTGKQCFAPEAVIRRADKVYGALALLTKAWSDLDELMPADSGCILCTAGTVPNPLNTGPCAYHAAVDILLYDKKDPFQK